MGGLVFILVKHQKERLIGFLAISIKISRWDPHEYWTDIDDFSQGDIKDVWELSRFDWVVAWSTQVANGDSEKIRKDECLGRRLEYA